MSVFYLSPGSAGLMPETCMWLTKRHILLWMTLVKKSRLTSCTSFKKSMKTSLLNTFGSTVTGKHGEQARWAWSWVDFPLHCSDPPGAPKPGCLLESSGAGGLSNTWNAAKCLFPPGSLGDDVDPSHQPQASLYPCTPESLNIHLATEDAQVMLTIWMKVWPGKLAPQALWSLGKRPVLKGVFL